MAHTGICQIGVSLSNSYIIQYLDLAIYILHKDVNMMLYTINLGLPHNVMHIKLKPTIISFMCDYKSRFKILIYTQKSGYFELLEFLQD